MSEIEDEDEDIFYEMDDNFLILYDKEKYPVMTKYLKAGYMVKPLVESQQLVKEEL